MYVDSSAWGRNFKTLSEQIHSFPNENTELRPSEMVYGKIQLIVYIMYSNYS